MKEMLIIAVGGAGTSIVKHALNTGMKVSVLVIDKDDSMVKIIGLSEVDFLRFDGNSQSFKNDFEGKIQDSKLIVIVGGVAGETAYRCIPIVADVSKKYAENVICFASLPFDFEGPESIERAVNVQKDISKLEIKLYTASLQQILDLGLHKTQKQMFETIGQEFLETLKEELRV